MERPRREAWWAARPWTTAALLYLPMAAVVLAHLLLPPEGRWPTGFLQYDQQSYMAMARESWEGGAWPLFGLPTSADPDTPRHYLYLHIAALGLLQGAFDLDPGRLYLAFGALAGLVFLRLAIALYRRVVPETDLAAGLGLVGFAWGGGLFVLAGGLAGLAEGRLDYATPFRFDPHGGFWFLNLGRNLFYGVEAWYHALALGLALAVMDRRWRAAVALAVLLLLSHPITGLQWALIALAWMLLRLLLRRRPAAPLWVPALLAALVGAHLGFHFLYLGAQPEHAALMSFWSRHFADFHWSAMLLAYGPVALAALVALRVSRAWREAPEKALFLLCWCAVAFALANHDLLIPPRQPLHFTRGYVWIPLFLLAAPLLVAALRRLLARARPLAFAALALLLADNAAWLSLQAWQNAGGFGAARTLSAGERAALAALAEPAYEGHLLVPADPRLGYDALVYTPLRSWYSQQHSTPDPDARLADLAAWRESGREPETWRRRALVFLLPDAGQALSALPWLTPDSEIAQIAPEPDGEPEAAAAGGEAFYLIRRPPQVP